MAYVNAEIENLTTGLVSGDLDSWATYHDQMTGGSSPSVGGSAFANFSGGITFYPDDWYLLANDTFAFGDEQAGLRIKISGSTHYVYMWVNGSQYGDWLCTVHRNPYGDSRKAFYASTIYVLVDDSNQLGTLIYQTREWDGGWGSTSMWQSLNWNVYRTQHSEVYQWAKRLAPPPLYNWQSVPSISGKNGILLLSTIQSVYLNDGDPVNNALESYIDFIDDSKVAVLVEQEIDDLTKVTVKYIVPTGTYEYIKLVYKVGSAPTSVTDGTAVDILQADKSVVLSGIADGSTYFFKIFTDITESEPYEFTTVRPAGENFFTIDLSSDGRDTMRYNASKTIHVQVDSVYSIHDVDYYAAQGALADPSSPSNPTYTISNGEVTTANGTQFLAWAYDITANQRIIPANCTLWFEFNAYFLNSEGYLDWRMYNGQGTEVIYWCWDTRYAFSINQWYNCKLEATITNGIITNIKYYVDNNMVDQLARNIHMLCIDEDNPIPLYFITFETTKPTKLKNMKIYWE